MTGAERPGPGRSLTPEADALDARLAVIAADFTAGYIGEPEAVARAVEAGCSPAGAAAYVANWAGGAP